jgi:hypothetical protein
MPTNLFANLPTSLPEELFTTLLQALGGSNAQETLDEMNRPAAHPIMICVSAPGSHSSVKSLPSQTATQLSSR